MESYSQNYKTFSRQIQKYKNAFLMNNHKNNKALLETERKSVTTRETRRPNNIGQKSRTISERALENRGSNTWKRYRMANCWQEWESYLKHNRNTRPIWISGIWRWHYHGVLPLSKLWGGETWSFSVLRGLLGGGGWGGKYGGPCQHDLSSCIILTVFSCIYHFQGALCFQNLNMKKE